MIINELCIGLGWRWVSALQVCSCWVFKGWELGRSRWRPSEAHCHMLWIRCHTLHSDHIHPGRVCSYVTQAWWKTGELWAGKCSI